MEKYLVNVTWINKTKNTIEINNTIYQEKEEATHAFNDLDYSIWTGNDMLGYPCDEIVRVVDDDQKIVKYNVLEVCTYDESLNEEFEVTVSLSEIAA